MKNSILCALVFVLLVIPVQEVLSQKKEDGRPKIGLVLSGGGAKGFAHIGFLKVLEEAGIKPDYITGTSAGSLVGALYSMGYTPTEMEIIAKNENWDQTMGNTVDLNRVAIEEKDYYGRYIFDLNIINGKFQLPGALVTGHQLEQLIARLTQPYHHVQDFSKFPIPFKCVATDLETGAPIVLDSGNIVKSIRASMSIPTIFLPVNIDGRLLVDGGLVRNFPVQEVIDMGADIVIGVYTGAQLKSKESLGSLVSVLSQSAFLMGIYDAQDQFGKCKVLIEPELHELTSNSFDKIDSIIVRGERTARKYYPQLKQLADSLNMSFEPVEKIDTSHIQAKESFYIDSIEVIGNNRTSREFILGKLKIDTGAWVTHKYLQNRIEVVYGTQYYKKIGYRIVEEDSLAFLSLDVEEVAPAKLRFALHYDTDTRTGLTVNFTSRNAIVPNSRFIAELDIADLPKMELSYFQYTGKKQDVALVARAKASQENEFIARNFNGQDAIFRMRAMQFSGGIQTTTSVNWSIGGFINKEFNQVRPTVNGDSIMRELNDQSAFLSGFFTLNTMNSQFFPTKGVKLDIRARFYFDMEQTIEANSQATLNEFLNANPLQQESYNNFDISLDKISMLTPKLSLLTGGFMGVHTTDQIQVTDSYFVGGYSPKNFGSVPFWGTEVNALVATHLAIGKLGLRWQPVKKLFIDGFANYIDVRQPFLTLDEGINTFTNNEESRFKDTFLQYDGQIFHNAFGGGIRFSYMTFFGPISLAFSKWEHSSKVQPLLSIGFTL